MVRKAGKMLLLLAAFMQPAAEAGLLAQQAGVSGAPGLLAGVSRIDITPPLEDLPKPFATIGSKIYVRTIVFQAGGRRAVLVNGDLPTIATDVFEQLVKRIAEAANAPVENVMLSVTHTHNAVRLDNNPKGIMLPGSAKVTAYTADLILRSVTEAVADLQPAKAGYGNGIFHLAAARMEPGQPRGSRQPAADRTLGVFKIERADGTPLAVLVNNGPEPVMAMRVKTEINADVAGVMERYVEQRFGDKAVVLYTVGSPPDVVINTSGGDTVAGRGALPPGATPADPHALMSAVGTVLGEEVIATLNNITTSADVRIQGMLQTLVCPGQITTPYANACSDAPGATLPKCVFTTRDGPPQTLRFGLIQIGDVALIHSDANILPAVWAKVKQQAPNPDKTMLVSLVFGPIHYVVDDSDYAGHSYPVTATTVKPGCAAPGFVRESLAMLNKAQSDKAR
ncbi:hypothetical protein [Sphingomonas sp.]|uniref:hypothetical protein n=1 Tax=Sphingomonas sp. TaxID=28214 RepID=UPI002D1645AC|nr:hypothetical protein [Sphingomonas sp.]HWK35425.1 hypothetical protein [Sphingomonas sp.]